MTKKASKLINENVIRRWGKLANMPALTENFIDTLEEEEEEVEAAEMEMDAEPAGDEPEMEMELDADAEMRDEDPSMRDAYNRSDEDLELEVVDDEALTEAVLARVVERLLKKN